MNQKQREYTVGRVRAIANAKIEKIKKRYTVPGADKDFVTGSLESGLIGFTGNVMQYSGRWYAEIDSSKFPRASYSEKEAEIEISKVRAETRRIEDEVMLGDAEESLASIRKFESE